VNMAATLPAPNAQDLVAKNRLTTEATRRYKNHCLAIWEAGENPARLHHCKRGERGNRSHWGEDPGKAALARGYASQETCQTPSRACIDFGIGRSMSVRPEPAPLLLLPAQLSLFRLKPLLMARCVCNP
jgi:hypothetical protein